MTALSILHDSRRGANHLKLSAHFLNLLGLLFELGCESLYLFLLLLLCDRCLQLLNFVIEHGLVRGLGAHARLRCVTLSAQQVPAPRLPVAPSKPSWSVVKVQSNCNNVAANRLGVVEDTTDEAG